MKRLLLMLVLLPWVLAACSPSQPDRRSQSQPLQAQIRALEQARQVEQTLQQTARKRDRQLERMSR